MRAHCHPRKPSGWPDALLGLAVAALFSTIPAAHGQGQPSRENEIKAAYISQFGRYVDFPAEAFSKAEEPFVIAAACSKELADQLTATTRKKTLHGRPIVVRRFNVLEEVGSCHVLFMSENTGKDLEAKVHAKFLNSPVLLVGEGEEYLTRGGMIAIYIRDGKVKLKMSREAAERVGLKPSNKLLQLPAPVD